MVIDTHCHLNDEQFENDYENIIKEAKNNNLCALVVVGSNLQTSKKAIELASKYDNVFAIIGTHPEEVNDFNNETIKFYKENSSNNKVVAIGEIGLDYHYSQENKEKQKQVLISQIKLAYECKLPICFHLRDAYLDFLQILNENKQYLTYGGVVHCYSGSLEYAKEMLKFGFKLGLDGPLTFKNNKKAVEIVNQLPLECFVVETDCPYLSPEPVRGTRNEPKNVNYIVNKVAQIKNMPQNLVEDILLENSKNLYPKLKIK